MHLLQAVAPYDLASPKTPTTAALYPVYLRGLAWLQDGQPQQASAEFQKILSHKGVAQNYLVFPLASLQLARAYKAMALQQRNATATNSGEGQAHAEEQAEAAYRDFLNIWTNADRNLPVLREAQREYRTLLASRSSRLRH